MLAGEVKTLNSEMEIKISINPSSETFISMWHLKRWNYLLMAIQWTTKPECFLKHPNITADE